MSNNELQPWSWMTEKYSFCFLQFNTFCSK